MKQQRIYLDYNATAPLRPEIFLILKTIMGEPLNASAVHSYGREGRKLIEQARTQVAALIKAPAAQVIFNSGATEGNNTVLNHFSGETILISAIEHDSIREVIPNALRIPVDTNGVVDLHAYEDLLKAHKPALVSVMLVNNETGVIQPIAKIAAMAHSHGALMHCDAVQAAGRIPIDIVELGVDFLTLSSHKIGGPQGAGALVLGLCGITPILLHGGGQEKKARAGTENVAGIVGLGAAAELALQKLEGEQERLKMLQHKLETGLQQIIPASVIYGQGAPRVSNTTLIGIPAKTSESLLMNFDLSGIALSNGAACSSGSVKPSHVLQAMKIDTAQAGTVRISTGWNTHESDIDHFLAVLEKISR
ncbi:MAG: cysteine desulfurase [Alphaproteobacteria bacterium]|nr:cysteine desulfurase [Alphaproteobacteria bacterium]